MFVCVCTSTRERERERERERDERIERNLSMDHTAYWAFQVREYLFEINMPGYTTEIKPTLDYIWKYFKQEITQMNQGPIQQLIFIHILSCSPIINCICEMML